MATTCTIKFPFSDQTILALKHEGEILFFLRHVDLAIGLKSATCTWLRDNDLFSTYVRNIPNVVLKGILFISKDSLLKIYPKDRSYHHYKCDQNVEWLHDNLMEFIEKKNLFNLNKKPAQARSMFGSEPPLVKGWDTIVKSMPVEVSVKPTNLDEGKKAMPECTDPIEQLVTLILGKDLQLIELLLEKVKDKPGVVEEIAKEILANVDISKVVLKKVVSYL